METLAPSDAASPNTEAEVHLLLERNPVDDWRRWRVATIGSIVGHLVLLVVLLLMPDITTNTRVYENPRIVRFTPLYIPTDLTQKAPNKGKLSKELTVAAIAPQPKFKAPVPAPARKAAPKFVPPVAPTPAPQVARVEPKPVVAEPPRIQPENPTAQQGDPLARLGSTANTVAPAPPSPGNGQPKLVLENVAPPPPPRNPGQPRPGGGLALPNTSVEAAIRELNSTGGVPSRQSVEDFGGEQGSPGAGLNLPPSAGRPRSNLELRSDPMGVDFRPYMQQVIAAVRRNWFAVYPEAARLGQKGEVVLEFAIAKQGLVTKVIFASESGAKALDQSAVAALSASNPLPPLPTGFKGDRIVLRMTFMYNMPR